jgi:methylase of polypeptide subunit release factors
MAKLLLSKQDEYYTPEEAVYPILEFIKPNSNILCPFDTKESNFVKIFKKEGYNVFNSHISEGKDFFKMRIKPTTKVDYIISNPPIQ